MHIVVECRFKNTDSYLLTIYTEEGALTRATVPGCLLDAIQGIETPSVDFTAIFTE